MQESHKEAGLPWWNSVALPTSAHFTCMTRYFGCFELGIPSLEAKSLIRGYWNYLWFCFLSQLPQLFRCLRLLIIFPLFFLVLFPCLHPYWLILGPSVFLCILLHQLALIGLSNFNILNNLKFFKSSLLLPGYYSNSSEIIRKIWLSSAFKIHLEIEHKLLWLSECNMFYSL